VQIAAIAADLVAWLQLLALDGDLAQAEPKQLRFRMLHVPAQLTRGSRQRRLRMPAGWPWADRRSLPAHHDHPGAHLTADPNRPTNPEEHRRPATGAPPGTSSYHDQTPPVEPKPRSIETAVRIHHERPGLADSRPGQGGDLITDRTECSSCLASHREPVVIAVITTVWTNAPRSLDVLVHCGIRNPRI
jgi:Transposase DDE domain group 1